jgi:hypothetical protein
MGSCVASETESNQVLFGIVTRLAAELFVMNFEIRHRATQLTPPAIASQHKLP